GRVRGQTFSGIDVSTGMDVPPKKSDEPSHQLGSRLGEGPPHVFGSTPNSIHPRRPKTRYVPGEYRSDICGAPPSEAPSRIRLQTLPHRCKLSSITADSIYPGRR